MRLHFVLILLLAAATTASVSASRPEGADSVANDVLSVEHARTAALEHSDTATLEKILGDDLTYVHASGKVDTKASFLQAIRSDDLHYISWQAKKLNVRVIQNSAVLDREETLRSPPTPLGW